MKDKQTKVEEIEASHTLGGSGEGGVQGIGKWRGYTCYSTVRYTKVKWSHRKTDGSMIFTYIIFLCIIRGKARATENTYGMCMCMLCTLLFNIKCKSEIYREDVHMSIGVMRD